MGAAVHVVGGRAVGPSRSERFDGATGERPGFTLGAGVTIPNAGAALIERAKVADYLLSSTHPVGRFKAVVFRSLGFDAASWSDLRDALHTLARSGTAIELPSTPFGRRYEVRGTLVGPNGRSARIVTAWIVRTDEDFPRFVTAYPE